MKDIIIIGAGVIGASIARVLARYQLDILVLEKESDVGDGASGANSAILHSGYDPEPDSLKAKYNVLGNPMFESLCKDLDIKMERNGSITLALSEAEVVTLDALAQRAKENGVVVKILDKKELKQMEPNISDQVIKGLFAPSAGIINPFELVVAQMENAVDNGVQLRLNEEVVDIHKQDYFTVTTTKASYQAKMIINASGVHADTINNMVNEPTFKIRPRRGEYLVLDHFDDQYLQRTLFSVPTDKGKGVLVTPTTHKNYLLGPTSYFIDDKEDVSTNLGTVIEVREKADKMMASIPYQHMIKQFAGNRAVSDNNDFIIEETSPYFINVAGIQSPGLVASPAIALEVKRLVSSRFELNEKVDYQVRRRPVVRMHDKSIEDKQALIQKHPEFGRIICRCEQISEGEVIDCIQRHVGATTIKGVKKRVRPGFGKCQGGFCEPRVMKILSEQLNIPLTEVQFGKRGSFIVKGVTKEGSHENL